MGKKLLPAVRNVSTQRVGIGVFGDIHNECNSFLEIAKNMTG
jgi:hypothetical protein